MKFGLRYCNTGRYTAPEAAAELVRAADETGFESVWTVDHVVVPSGYQSTYPYAPSGRMAGEVEDMPLPDPLIWLAFAAAASTRVKLATGILIVPQRNPVVTAKQVATLDRLSGGRMLFGIGVGWLEEEFNVLGAEFAERGARTDEYIAAMRALWSQAPASFEGKYLQFPDTYCEPRPAAGSVPIIVGGHTKAAARRAGRIGDGFFPARSDGLELIPIVRQSAEEAGRDPDSVEITASMPDDLEQIPELVKAGVSRVLVPVRPMGAVKQQISGPEAVAEWAEILSRFADFPPFPLMMDDPLG